MAGFSARVVFEGASSVNNNNAGGFGGGLGAGGNAVVVLTGGSNVQGNMANKSGGGVFAGSHASAFYDCKEERWVLIFASYPNPSPDVISNVTATLFVAVSYSEDPLDDWRVYALEARPQIAPGYRFASAGGATFHPYGAQVRLDCLSMLLLRLLYCD